MSTADNYRKVSAPYGFSMLDVEATAAREKTSRAAQNVVRAHGFERIIPAMIDYPETFSERLHSEMFSMKDNSGERLALRNDITAQVIKGYVRQIERRAGVRKFYYAAPVYKDVRKNYPLPREIYQIGCEVIGDKADSHLSELITISRKILQEVLRLEVATQLTDMRFRNTVAAALGDAYLDAERRRDVPYFAEQMVQHFKLEIAAARRLALFFFYPANAAVPKEASMLPQSIHQALQKSAATAQGLVESLRRDGVESFWQPLSEPRSSYYTDIFFETYAQGFTEPLVRGGVYNDLVKRYAPLDVGACGFALDLLTY